MVLLGVQKKTRSDFVLKTKSMVSFSFEKDTPRNIEKPLVLLGYEKTYPEHIENHRCYYVLNKHTETWRLESLSLASEYNSRGYICRVNLSHN